MKLIRVITAALAVCAGPAVAASNSVVTAGAGVQYGFVSGDVAQQNPAAPEHQYGLVGRLKVIRFIGLELGAQLDQDPKTQRERLLSPRLQVALMANVFPSDYVNLFIAGGFASHELGDLFDPSGTTTSYHVGPGLEVFVGDHLAVGGDLRARIPNAGYVKAQVTDELSAAPITGLLDVWQANLTVAYYL